MVRAIREGLEILHANDIPITPSNHRVLRLLAQEFRALSAARLPTPAMDRLFEHLASTAVHDVAS